MIIETPDGAVLEVFWRQRGSKPWSQVTALQLLSRYCGNNQSLQGLRGLFSERADSGRTWRTADNAILHRAAELIASGSVIIVECGGTARWPGSGFVLGSGGNSALLFWRDRLHLHRDLFQVGEWLAKMRAIVERVEEQRKPGRTPDKSATKALEEIQPHITALRQMLSSAPSSPHASDLPDHELLKLMGDYFQSGDLLPIYHRYPGFADPGPDAPPPQVASSFKPSKDSGTVDPDTFLGSDDQPQQSVCMACAAQNGTPFIEIAESPANDNRTWIEIELLDTSGQPVPDIRYKIHLPDGSEATGQLDARGRARHEQIVPGQCRITFPDLDGRDWRPT